MSLAERIVDGNPWGYLRIRSGDFDLIVEKRDLYTTYKIVRAFRGRYYYHSQEPILYHSVRTPEPVPIRPAHIIHARHVPWWLTIYYMVRSAIDKRRWDREMKAARERERIRINALRDLAERHMPGRFKGRYN
jgi:hypothetical protein